MNNLNTKIVNFYKKQPVVAIATTGIVFTLVKYGLKEWLKGGAPVVPPIDPVPQKPNVTSKYTYGRQQYADLADVLFNAFDGTGTDEDTVREVMSKMKTYDDVLALIDAFGTRDVSTVWGWSNNYTLAQAIYAEMSPSYIQIYVNAPLKRTGYRF